MKQEEPPPQHFLGQLFLNFFKGFYVFVYLRERAWGDGQREKQTPH